MKDRQKLKDLPAWPSLILNIDNGFLYKGAETI